MKVALLFTLATLAAAIDQKAVGPDPLATFGTGRWVANAYAEKDGLDKACKEHWEEFRLSADRRDVNTKHVSGATGSYRVLYAEGATAALYLNDESRRDPAGDRIIWMLIVESQDRFRWRIHGQHSNPDNEARFARVRCK